MAKIVFRAEIRLPKQIILPLNVAREADSPRVLNLRERKVEVAEPIANYLEARHPGWVEAQPQGKDKNEPDQPKNDAATESSPDKASDTKRLLPPAKLERLTIAQLQDYAAEWGVDLGDATKHDAIVDVIVKALSDGDEAADSSADGS